MNGTFRIWTRYVFLSWDSLVVIVWMLLLALGQGQRHENSYDISIKVNFLVCFLLLTLKSWDGNSTLCGWVYFLKWYWLSVCLILFNYLKGTESVFWEGQSERTRKLPPIQMWKIRTYVYSLPSGHTTSVQRWSMVEISSWRCFNVDSTLNIWRWKDIGISTLFQRWILISVQRCSTVDFHAMNQRWKNVRATT